MITSQPAASAARASSADSICQPHTAPAAWTFATRSGSAAARKKSMYGARAMPSSSVSGSISGTRKFTPNADPSSASSTGASAAAGSVSAGYIA